MQSLSIFTHSRIKLATHLWYFVAKAGLSVVALLSIGNLLTEEIGCILVSIWSAANQQNVINTHNFAISAVSTLYHIISERENILQMFRDIRMAQGIMPYVLLQ